MPPSDSLSLSSSPRIDTLVYIGTEPNNEILPGQLLHSGVELLKLTSCVPILFAFL